MHNQFKTQKFKHLMLAMGPRDLNSAPYSPVHCSSHSMTSFQSSELTELPVVENSQLFAQRTVRPLSQSVSQRSGCPVQLAQWKAFWAKLGPQNAHNSQTMRTCVGSPQQHIFFVSCLTPRQVLARPKMGHNPYFLATTKQWPDRIFVL